MSESLEPLPDDVAHALEVERQRAGLPEASKSGLVARIEGSHAFAVASGQLQVGDGPAGAATGSLLARSFEQLHTPTGMLLFAVGALWGLVLGAGLIAIATTRLPHHPVPVPAEAAAHDAGH